MSRINTPSKSHDYDDDVDDESDWEKEIMDNGDVFFVNVGNEGVNVLNVTSIEQEDEKEKVKSEKQGRNLKLSRLVRRRESKRDRSRSTRESDEDSTSYAQIKTFESFVEGANPSTSDMIMIDVSLNITPLSKAELMERGRSLIERLLGIVPRVDENDGNFVVIAGYTTDGPALKLGQDLRIGDRIRSIDGHRVTAQNVDDFLRKHVANSNRMTTTITVQRSSKSEVERVLRNEQDSSLKTPPTYLQILSGNGPSPSDVQGMLSKLPHFAAYLDPNKVTESSPELADVVYQYPSGTYKLLKIRGILTTLCSASPEVTGNSLISKTLVASIVFEGGELVHVVCIVDDGDRIFLMAVPDIKLSADYAERLIEDTARVLRFQYGSLNSAFSTSSKSKLDSFFSVLFLDAFIDIQGSSEKPILDTETILSPSSSFGFRDLLLAIQGFQLPEDIKFQIDDALSQFEAADFRDLTDGFYDLPREFDILGSCLFHKGLLLASHLPRDNVLDIYLWLRFNNLLRLTKSCPVTKVVTWNRVFIFNKRSEVILLVVGSGHQLLGVLMETTINVSRPDPFYVDHAFNTLDHLSDMGIPVVCDRWLTLPPNPDIIDADSLAKNPGRKTELKGGIILKKTKNVEYSSGTSNSSESSDKKRVFEDYEDEEDDDEEERSTAFRGSLSSSFHEVLSSFEEEEEDEEVVSYRVSQLSLSEDNTVFHYLYLDIGEAVFISPLREPKGPLHQELLSNVETSCRIIHETFEMAVTNGERLRKKDGTDPWLNRSAVAVKEQGMLFHWSPIRDNNKPVYPVLCYWVCGRLFLSPNRKECYVCYHDSAPQNMIELAFRLAHGVNI